MSEDRTANLWSWHAKCVAMADAAKARNDKHAWHYWSEAAAETLAEIVG